MVNKKRKQAQGGAEHPVQLHSVAQQWAFRRGLSAYYSQEMRQEGLGGFKAVEIGGGDLGMPAARQFTMCNTCLSAPKVPLCTIKMTEQFISCTGMIDMSYL